MQGEKEDEQRILSDEKSLTPARVIMLKYDATADGYDELYQDEQGLKYLAAWKFITKMSGKIVDIGCGTLLFERFLSSYGTIKKITYIVGLDISEKMMESGLSKILNDDEISRRLDLVRGDASRLPFRELSFDYGVSFTVFTLLDSEIVGIREMEKVVKRGGVFSLLKKFVKSSLEKYNLMGETDKDYIYTFEKTV